MKLSRSFIWSRKQDREGWKPKDAPSFDPGLPVHVAHDMLEHFTGGDAFQNELMAFGSILYGRAYKDPSGAMTRTAADDLAEFLVEQNFRIKKSITRWDRELKDSRAETILGQMLQLTYFKLVVMHNIPTPTAGDAVRRCAPWIRLGYRLAERRWKGNHDALEDMFIDVYNHVAVDHNRRKPQLGEHLKVSVDTEARITHLEREPA